MSGTARNRTALRSLASEFGSSKVCVYTEARFDDLFRAPLTNGAKRVSVRLDLPEGTSRDLNLVYWCKERGRLHKNVVTLNLGAFDPVRPNEKALSTLPLPDLIRFQYRGIPVGLHAWETVLRYSLTAFTDPPGDKDIENLVELVDLSSYLVEGVSAICKDLRPAFFFSGHDCYLWATVKNTFIAHNVPSWTLYKSSYNPVFTKASQPYTGSGRSLFSRRFMEASKSAQQAVWKTHADRAHEKIAKLTENYRALDYMVGNFDSFDYKNVVGGRLSHVDDAKCFLSTNPQARINPGEVVFVLALHSFADEACEHGIDDFIHMASYFRHVAEAIARTNPKAYIAVRFHPNTLSQLKFLVQQADAELQSLLYRELQAITDRVVVSCCSARLHRLQRHYRTCVVTRWGTIGREAIHLGIPVICSPLAAYAKMLPREWVMESAEDVLNKVEIVGKKLAAGESFQFAANDIGAVDASTYFRSDGRDRLPHILRSKQGIAYAAARNQPVAAHAALPYSYRLLRRILPSHAYKRFTCAALKSFLVQTAENKADRNLIKERLGW